MANGNNRSGGGGGGGHPSNVTVQSPGGCPAATDDAATGAAKEPAEEDAAAAAAAATRSLSRPANFGVGAVDVAVGGGGGQYGGGGRGPGADEGVGLELPPIEEDQVYRREMAAMRAAGGEVRTGDICTCMGKISHLLRKQSERGRTRRGGLASLKG